MNDVESSVKGASPARRPGSNNFSPLPIPGFAGTFLPAESRISTFPMTRPRLCGGSTTPTPGFDRSPELAIGHW